jgi:hypothetical protein
VVIGATSLYREIEQKTIFPILARPILRAEYLVGKYAGTLLTLAVFIALDASVALLILARHGETGFATIGAVVTALVGSFAAAFWRMPRWRTYLPIPWAAVSLVIAALLAGGAVDDRRVVLGASALALGEVMIISGIATFFSAFTSPFLTAVCTFGLFIVGRDADTLGRLPARVFGTWIAGAGAVLSKVVPNLQLYVPPRALLTGEMPGTSLYSYVGLAIVQSVAWTVGLLVLANWIFKKRDLL